jgi:predicted RecA/RadA family phage recombinase
MYLDAAMLLSGSVAANGALTGQAVNGAGSFLSANTIDIGPLALGGNQAGDIGVGEELFVEFSVLTAPTGGTNVRFQLIQADDAALATNVQVINQTDDLPIANLPAGTVVPLHWDPAQPYSPKRYVGVRYVNTGAIATFSVVAAVVKNVQTRQTSYKSGFSVA